MTQPEFSRPVRVDTLGDQPRRLTIEAGEEERAALARRFRLAMLERLTAEAALVRKGADVQASGRIRADAVQFCVATGEPVAQDIDEPFEIVFRPAREGGGTGEEIELGADEMDVVFHDGATVDLGEAAAETLSLALDPYPRAPGAHAALREAGVKTEGEAGPFGALVALKDKFGE